MVTTEGDYALDAARLLDLLLTDIVVGTRSIEIFSRLDSRTTIRPTVLNGMHRMCHSHILLGLCKFIEFYKSYHGLIPSDCKEPCKNMMKIIESKKIGDFRNKYVAHIIDNETGRPLNIEELDVYLKSIYGHDGSHFVSWVNDRKNNFPDTVVSVVARTRDYIMKDNGITKEEMNQCIET